MTKRQVQVFTAGCPVCEPAVKLVNEMACPDCEVTVHDLHDAAGAARASSYGVQTVPAVVVDGRIASWCGNAGPNKEELSASGVGQPV